MKNVIAVILLIIIGLFFIFYTNFTPISVIENDSYAIANDKITENLYNDKLKASKASIKLLKVKAYDSLYKQNDQLYVGDIRKKIINSIYPLYTNDNLAIINLSSDSKLIDTNFEKYSGYENFTLTSGVLYNKEDKERADQNDYLFLELSNSMFINSKPLTIKTKTNEYKIGINSVIRFAEEDIRYYQPNTDTFEYFKIEDIDLSSDTTINDNKYSYKDLLLNLGIIKQNNDIEEDVPSKPEEPSNEEPTLPSKPAYTKPTVKCEKFATSVYSATSRLIINDPSGAISKPIVFEVRTNDKLYLRKAFISSGDFQIVGLLPSTEFEITGTFTYTNELGKEIKETVIKQTVKTKDVKDLPPITLSFDNGPIYYNKIELINFKIKEGIDTETAKGIAKAIIIINNEKYKMASNDLHSLLSGKSITYISPEKLKSNSQVDYQVMFYDNYNNELSVINSTGKTLTSKSIPKASIKIESNDVTLVKLKVTLENPDNISMTNYKCVVFSQDSKVINESLIPENGEIKLTNLNSNELFSIFVYADFDTSDGNGTKKNQLIGETKFTSVPITTLGYIRLTLKMNKIESNSATVSMAIDIDNTDNRLVSLLKNLTLNISTSDDDKEKVVYTKSLSDDNINKLKIGQTIENVITNLESSTDYFITVDSLVTQGTTEYNLSTLLNMKSFKTMKKKAQILIKNAYATTNIIDFDVKVVDEDSSIESNRVVLEVRGSNGKVVAIDNIKINDDYQRLTYNKLKSSEKYTFKYIAEEYNEGYDNSTYFDNYSILKQEIYTEEGISGSIAISSLLQPQIGKNLFDLSNYQRWKSNGVGEDIKNFSFINGTVTLSALNGWHNYSYYLYDYIGKTLTISFYAKYQNEIGAEVYIANSDGNVTTYKLSNLNEQEWQKYTYTFTLNASGYIGFNIREISGKNHKTSVIIKNLQIEENDKATSFEPFKQTTTYDASMLVNLNDVRSEITTNDYYIKIYKDNLAINQEHYSMDGLSNVIDKSHKYSLDKNAEYRLELIVKIRDRFYTINSVTFTTENEIRSIKTLNDFFKMHVNGKYLVLNDLDFTTNGSTYTSPFNGEIDFQGHTVKLSVQGRPSYIIQSISETGIIKNINIEVAFDNTVERSSYYGFNQSNYGKIENIIVTITMATAVPNVAIDTISYVNYGSIENFVINSKVALHGQYFFSTGVLHNYGMMRNGYVYGENIDATFSNQTTSSKQTGPIAGYTSSNSRIENVFSLIGVNTFETGNNNKQVGSIIGNSNRGLIQNVYSVADGINTNLNGDPNVGQVSSVLNTNNLFYASKKIYNTNYSQKISSMSIRDIEFQNKVLNGDNKFVVDELVSNGFYPQLSMPDCMPKQELLPLIIVEDTDLVDITSTEVLENNNTSAKVLLNVNNPYAEKITKIDIKDVDTVIVSQTNFKGKSEVVVNIVNPIKYVSKYYVKSITSVGALNIAYIRNYKDNERALYFDLYRTISNVSDWNKIKQSPSENYALTSDLDFKNAVNFVVGNFFGKLNGNGHTISNIEIISGTDLFNTLTGSIVNLFVKNYKKTNSSSNGALIDTANNNSVIDNVHMTNVSINATSYVGGIVAYASGALIKNSSVTNFKNITDKDMVDIRIGALAGYLGTGYIQNSYAQDVNIDITDSIYVYAVGGLIGQVAGGTIDNCYAIGNIKTNSSSTGGLVGEAEASISE
jgi:hypothetical protein